MMKQIDVDFIAAAERKGWRVQSAEEGHLIVSCPGDECQMKAKLVPGKKIPRICTAKGHPHDMVVRSFDDLRQVLRNRRNDLRLSMTEVEEASGMAQDQLLKCERENPTRIPNLDMGIFWAAALGYEIVLRPVPLPRVTARKIVETRDMVERRGQNIVRMEARRDKDR